MARKRQPEKISAHATPELLTEEEAARFLRISPKTLTTCRSIGRYNLPFVRIGGRIRYELAALRLFIEQRRVSKPPVRAVPVETAQRANMRKTA